MSRCSVPLLMMLLLTLVCQGAVARIHLMVSPPVLEKHHHDHQLMTMQAEADCHPTPCHGSKHYCEGECGNCQILISPTSLVASQVALAVTRHSPPVAPPLMHVDSRPPERALRPPIG
ncbi:hypothetical protein FCL40_15425 [Ferrimonas sediminicola]|uniref:DUF2946 domain-containing protein n=1 Tax=Ferrimonas sediminicola TaxID=2569538 RepID=A0A4U1BA30_9GAMM|nr:hypothetical protein [Ferrimonas sediminicola]TKB47603.1 hypothetical protein FCL40_15425 [Ferrimonas sediminicola]